MSTGLVAVCGLVMEGGSPGRAVPHSFLMMVLRGGRRMFRLFLNGVFFFLLNENHRQISLPKRTVKVGCSTEKPEPKFKFSLASFLRVNP